MAEIAKPAVAIETDAESRRKEAYFTASQWQLVRARFKSNKTAMFFGWCLIVMIAAGLFAPFLSPYDPTIAGRDKEYENGPPQMPKFWDENGFSFRPFIYGTERYRGMDTNFRWVIKVNRDDRRYVQWFVKDWEYSFIDIDWDLPGDTFDVRIKTLTFDRHLFGVDKGGIHLFGTAGLTHPQQ